MNDEVTRGRRRRRDQSLELKRELVARSLLPGASVSAIALEAGINANLLFTWRRAHLDAMATPASRATASSAVLLPVTISPSKDAALPAAVTAPRTAAGTIETDMSGARVRLRGAVDEASVRCVLQALRGLA